MGKKIDDIKQKIDKFERGCFLTIQPQVDILREKLNKLGDNQSKCNKELNKLLSQFDDQKKDLKALYRSRLQENS